MYEAFNILDDMVNRNLICGNAVRHFKNTLVSRVEKKP